MKLTKLSYGHVSEKNEMIYKIYNKQNNGPGQGNIKKKYKDYNNNVKMNLNESKIRLIQGCQKEHSIPLSNLTPQMGG